MILTGLEIVKEYEAGRIIIDPFDMRRVQPNSYDVTLHPKLLVHRTPERPLLSKKDTILDMKQPAEDFFEEVVLDDRGYVLLPGQFYLACTNEIAGSDHYVPYIDGKSSVGRLGICVHVTAGRGDVGFKSRWTLEITAAVPVRIYPNVPIGQVTFHSVQGEKRLYTGKYVQPRDQDTGPVVSQYHRNFVEKLA